MGLDFPLWAYGKNYLLEQPFRTVIPEQSNQKRAKAYDNLFRVLEEG